jgi:hypothetical protein
MGADLCRHCAGILVDVVVMGGAFMMLATLQMITLHQPDGNEVQLNVETVISMRGRQANYKGEYDAAGHFTENAKCVINTSDGKFVAVSETCKEVMRIFVESEKAP